MSKTAVFWAWVAHGPFQAATTFGCNQLTLSGMQKFLETFIYQKFPDLLDDISCAT